MTDITPPPELVEQWIEETRSRDCIGAYPADLEQCVAARAAARAAAWGAAWGADQELEACCYWLDHEGWSGESRQLRAARRPKTQSMKEQALADLHEIYIEQPFPAGDSRFNRIRRALEALPDD